MGNSMNNSCGTARMALNYEGRALRNIELVNANAGLMAELDQGRDTLAAMMEQVHCCRPSWQHNHSQNHRTSSKHQPMITAGIQWTYKEAEDTPWMV